jgi:hypothetical protein
MVMVANCPPYPLVEAVYWLSAPFDFFLVKFDPPWLPLLFMIDAPVLLFLTELDPC